MRETHSVSAGLDYPAVGPEHADLHDAGRAAYPYATDAEALRGFQALAKLEGILPALESAHAVGWVLKEREQLRGKRVLVNVSGRGDKDLDTLRAALGRREVQRDRIACKQGSPRCAAQKRCGLAPYVTAGDGGMETTLAVLRALDCAGGRLRRARAPVQRSDRRRPGAPGRGRARARRGRELRSRARSDRALPARGADRQSPDRAHGLRQPAAPSRLGGLVPRPSPRPAPTACSSPICRLRRARRSPRPRKRLESPRFSSPRPPPPTSASPPRRG